MEGASAPMGDLTTLLAAWQGSGAQVPIDALWQAAYGELKRLARSRLRRQGPLTVLDTTALVNESYLRLVGRGRLTVETRAAFFAFAARVMRSVVVDVVRERRAQRRGGDAERVALDSAVAEQVGRAAWTAREVEPLDVDAALVELERVDARLARVVEMRYFAGYTEPEIAAVLGVTERTVRRDWQKAKLVLRAMIAS